MDLRKMLFNGAFTLAGTVRQEEQKKKREQPEQHCREVGRGMCNVEDSDLSFL